MAITTRGASVTSVKRILPSLIVISAARLVLVAHDLDAGARAQREVAQQVAAGQRRDQQVLGIVLAGVAAEGRIGRAVERRLALDLDPVGAIIGIVGSGAASPGPGPDEVGGKVMLLGHGDDCSRGRHRRSPPW